MKKCTQKHLKKCRTTYKNKKIKINSSRCDAIRSSENQREFALCKEMEMRRACVLIVDRTTIHTWFDHQAEGEVEGG